MREEEEEKGTSRSEIIRRANRVRALTRARLLANSTAKQEIRRNRERQRVRDPSGHSRGETSVEELKASGFLRLSTQRTARKASKERPGSQNQGCKLDPSCEACWHRKVWCGFDHTKKVFIKGPQATRIETKCNGHIAKLRKGLVENLEPSERVHFFKLLARMETHFQLRPVKARNDPRLVEEWLALPLDRGMNASALGMALGHIGLQVDNEDAALLLRAAAGKSRQQNRVRNISTISFTRLCAAARCYQKDLYPCIVTWLDRQVRHTFEPKSLAPLLDDYDLQIAALRVKRTSQEMGFRDS